MLSSEINRRGEDLIQEDSENSSESRLDNLYEEGWKLLDAQVYQQALDVFTEALKLKPESYGLIAAAAKAFLGLGNYEEGIAYCEKAIKICPVYSDAHYLKGNAWIALGKVEEAVACYDQALQLGGDADILNNKGVALVQLGRVDAALVCFNRAADKNPSEVGIISNQGQAYLYLQKYEQAQLHYEKALEIEPYFFRAVLGKAMAKMQLHHYHEAVEYFGRALYLDQNFFEYHFLNQASHLAIYKKEQVIICCEKALAVEPARHDLLSFSGLLFIIFKEYEKALSAYAQALTLKPEKAGTLYNMSYVLVQLGRQTEATQYFQQAQAIFSQEKEGHSPQDRPEEVATTALADESKSRDIYIKEPSLMTASAGSELGRETNERISSTAAKTSFFKLGRALSTSSGSGISRPSQSQTEPVKETAEEQNQFSI